MNIYPATYFIIAATSAISFYAFSNSSFSGRALFSIDRITGAGEYYRIFSSILIHANTGHLLFNMFSLYAFGIGLEMKYGAAVTAVIYICSGLCAGLLSLILHRNDSGYSALGASGAVCGVIFASIFLIPGGSIIIFPLPVPLPAWLYAILFVFGSIYAVNRAPGGIAHDAHLGGALAGVVIAAVIDFETVTRNPLLLAGVVIPVIVFFIFNREIEKLLKR